MFLPALAAGLGGGGMLTWAAHQAWFRPGSPADVRVGESAWVASATVPVAGALGLVVLASWGVVLVTRGRVRRAVAAAGLLASLATLGVAVDAALTGDRQLVEALRDLGAASAVSRTWWPWVAVVSGTLAVVASAAAVRWCASWPQMSARYDAPSGRRAGAATSADPGNLDLWKALDEGRDPTEGRS